MATKTPRMKAPKYYVANMGISPMGKLVITGDYRDYESAWQKAMRDFKEFAGFGFTYLLPVLVISAPSKSVASLPLAAEAIGTGRKFEAVIDIIKGKARGGRLREGTLEELERVLAGEAKSAGSPKRASKPKSGSPKRASKPKSGSPKRSPKQLSFPSKLGFARGSSR